MQRKTKVKIAGHRHSQHAMAVFVSLFAVIGCIALFTSHAATPVTAVELENGTITSPATKVTDSNASGGSAIKFGSYTPPPPPTCTISALLVNSCRPWVGEAASGYPQVASGTASQFTYAEKRLNNPNTLNDASAATTITNQFDVLHTYHSAGQTTLSADEQSFLTRANTYLLMNWKPADPWAQGDGSNSTVNAEIDAMADTMNTYRSHKIFLAIYHEPENNVSSGNCTGNAANAASGSPTDYVNMWHNVRARFNAKGVTNVVWVMNYMGFSGWDCLVKPLWPGNSYVDWVTWDNYGQGSTLFSASVSHFYNYLTTNSDSTYSFTSKTWGLSEYGYGNANGNSTQANTSNYWADAKSTFDANTYPRIKMYIVFDTTGNGGKSCVGLLFCSTSTVNVASQTAYNGFIQDVINSGP